VFTATELALVLDDVLSSSSEMKVLMEELKVVLVMSKEFFFMK
jgi:hypothetical protein